MPLAPSPAGTFFNAHAPFSLRGWIGAALIAWLPVAAMAAGERGGAEFFSQHPALRFIEQRLPAGMSLDFAGDLPVPRQVATDQALGEALSTVLDEFFTPPANFAAKAPELIGEVCRYRPAQAPQWVGLASRAILAAGLEGAERDLVATISVAVAVNPAGAGISARQALREIALATEAERAPRPPLDLTTAGRYASSVVLAAVKAVREQPHAAELISTIADEALQEAREQQANYLLVESLAAAIKGAAGIENAAAADLARLAYVRYARDKETAGLICAAALKGGGAEVAAAVKDQAALNLPVPTAAFVTIVSNAYVTTAEVPDAPGGAIARSITVTNADFIPALMIGAIVAKPASAVDILLAGLNRDLVLHGRATVRELVGAATMASEARAAEFAAAAVGRGDPTEGDAPALLAEGLARAVPISRLGVALAAQFRAQPRGDAAIVRATVGGALAGVVARGAADATGMIAFVATGNTGAASAVLDQIFISAPPEKFYAGVLGVLAAAPAPAPALLDRALGQPGLDSQQLGAIRAGGSLILEIQRDPRSCFAAAVRRLRESESAPPEVTSALLLATALANPRGVGAVVAVAVARGLPADLALAVIAQASRGLAAGIALTTETAAELAAQPAAAPRTIARRFAANPGAVDEILLGAVAARPALAPVFGRAAALAAPASVGKILPRLFAFSAGEMGAISDEQAAGLMAAVIHGIRAAELDSPTENATISEAVAAAVRTVFACAPANRPAAQPVPGLAAVITAAVEAAPQLTIEIARSAARSARLMADRSARPGMISAAVLAGSPGGSAARVDDAVAAGFHEADLQVPAASVRAIFDYSFDSLAGPPMTHYLDL